MESLIIIPLDMKVPCELVAALRPHCFVLCVVEGVQGKMLDLVVIFLEEEVVGQMVEHHGIPAVNGVGFAQLLHPGPNALRGLLVKLEDRKANLKCDLIREYWSKFIKMFYQSSHTILI